MRCFVMKESFGASGGSRSLLLLVLGSQVGDELGERFHLCLVHQLELSDEVIEVLEAGVQVGLFTEGDDAVEVTVVDVGVDSEQALVDRLHDRLEVLRERHVRM